MHSPPVHPDDTRTNSGLRWEYQNHSNESGRATSVGDSGAVGRPFRSVLLLGVMAVTPQILNEAMSVYVQTFSMRDRLTDYITRRGLDQLCPALFLPADPVGIVDAAKIHDLVGSDFRAAGGQRSQLSKARSFHF